MRSSESPGRIRLYAITDRKSLSGRDVLALIAGAVDAGMDMIQIREKDLSDKRLCELARGAVRAAEGSSTEILINDRLDVALAAGADGVHLGNHSAPAREVRRAAGPAFRIGVSTHSLDEARRAQLDGADFITFGPVFYTPSKARFGPPLGVEALADVCSRLDVPVLPLGGINVDNYAGLLSLPVAGLAAISLFQNAPNLADLVAELRRAALEAREC